MSEDGFGMPFAVPTVSCVAGMGVFPPGNGEVAPLICVACRFAPPVGFFDTGARYVWPVAGVNVGKEDASAISFVREVTADNWGVCQLRYLKQIKTTHHSTADDIDY